MIKWKPLDINNIPKERVIGLNKDSNLCQTGVIEVRDKLAAILIKKGNPKSINKNFYSEYLIITHYILEQDLLLIETE